MRYKRDKTGKYRRLTQIPNSPSEGVGLETVLGLKPASPAIVLENKARITDNMELINYEALVTSMTINLALDRLRHQTKWGLRQWKLAHQIIFNPIYTWAGKLRTVDIAKQDTQFTPKEKIVDQANAIFTKFYKRYAFRNDILAGLKKLPREDLAMALADLYGDLNFVHPFREGNGRSMRIMCTAIARQAGYDFDWRNISCRKYDFDQACKSHVRGKESPLTLMFREILWPYEGVERMLKSGKSLSRPDRRRIKHGLETLSA